MWIRQRQKGSTGCTDSSYVAENGWTSSYLNEIFSQDAPTDIQKYGFWISTTTGCKLWLDYGYGYAGGEVFTTDGSTTEKVYLSHGAAYTIPVQSAAYNRWTYGWIL